MKKANWLLCFSILQAITIITLLSIVLLETKAYTIPLQIFAILICVISYGALYMVYRTIIQRAKLEADNDILTKQIALQKEHYIASQKNEKQLLEIKNKLLQKMNVQHPEAFQDEAATRAYINELIEKSDQIQQLEYCQNKVIDTILYNKFLIAKANRIKIESEVILPDDLSIDPLDCMRLFTNLLDNAIEACASVSETERFLTIKSRINNHTMILQVTNSKLKENKINLEHPLSTKKDKENHGLGISIIQDVVKRNRGNISVDDQENQVSVNITLQV